jgi:hypothetical protein
MNSLEALEIVQRINSVDWNYQYSDDYGVYLRGQASVATFNKWANEREWTSEDIEMIKHEAMNYLKLSGSYKDFPQGRYDFFVKKIDQLFKVKKEEDTEVSEG